MRSAPFSRKLFPRSARLLLLLLALMSVASSGWAAPRMVTSAADDNTAGTLRATILAAQPGDVISFAPTVTGPITLTLGELLVSKNLTITGPGAAMLTINANGLSRVFHVTGGAVAISGLTLTGGAVGSATTTANGGAVSVDAGSLNLSGCTVSASTATSANSAIGGGGGLAVAAGAAATLATDTFSGDTATIAQGASEGGGVLNQGRLTVTGSIFSGDAAGNGGGIYNAGTLTLTGTNFGNNTMTMNGGGLYGAAASRAAITNCMFSSNIAGFSGGAICEAGQAGLSATTLTGNMAGGGTGPGASDGGGLTVLTGGNVSLQSCIVSSNTAALNSAGSSALGGGLCMAVNPDETPTIGTLQVTQTTISGNTANVGAGIALLGTPFRSANLTLTASTVSGNTAAGSASAGDGGGGLYVGTGGTAGLTNDTISGNTTTNGNGGGVDADNPDSGQALLLVSCTLSNNAANNGSGGGLVNAGAATASLQATLVAGNFSPASASPDIQGAFTSAGSNLLGDATGATGFTDPHDQFGGYGNAVIDPLLGPLQPNGGPTQTQALLMNSPAINGDYSANPPATDQRGVSRPIGPRADIGAFEAPSPPVAPTNVTATPGNTQIFLSWTAASGAVSYNVYRSTTAGQAAAQTTAINATPILGTHYTDYGLTNGTTYYYVVRAVNTAGLSPPSTPEAFATPTDTRVHGEVLAWGDNQSGELGNGTFTRSLTAVPLAAPAQTGTVLNNIVQVSGGVRYSLALTAAGQVYAWGDDTYGQLGDNNTTNSSALNNSDAPTLVQTRGGNPLTGIIAISAGQNHALALASDGTVYAWGRNQYGQLGSGATDSEANGFTSDNPYAAQVQTSIGGRLRGVVAIAAGGYHSLAVLSDGSVAAWGYNSSGQLGNGTSGTNADSAYPVAVSNLLNAVSVAAGQYFSLALANDGTISAWGYNQDGELGDNNAGTDESTPVPVQLTDVNTGNPLTATQIACGNLHSLALTSVPSIYAWGDDTLDELGDGGSGGNGFGGSYSPTPIPVGALSALEVAAGGSFSLAVQPDHSVMTWGANGSGQLGIGTVSTSQPPSAAQTSLGTALLNIYHVAGGSLHSLAIQNLPPVAGRAAYTVGVGIARTVPAPGLLAFATDAENDTPLTAVVMAVRAPAHGTVTISANGGFTYTPTAGYSGADSFTYKVNDGLADSAPATVTLNVVPETLQSITVTPQTVSLAENATQQFTATGNYNDGNTNDLTNQVQWASSNMAVATISNTSSATTSPGLATTSTATPGQTTITATLPASGLVGTATLTVVRTLQSLTVAPATKSLPKGETAQFTATAVYTDGFTQDVTATIRFSSQNRAVAAFTPGTPGLLTAVGVGTTTITARDPATGISGTATVTVTAAALVSITVTPANATLSPGQTRQYTASATYSDGTTADISQNVNWSTANSIVATVDSTGILSAQGVGQTTITATDPTTNLTGSTGVIVTNPNVAPRSHILFNLTGGAVALWNVDTAGNVAEHLYGPFANYRATALATGPDGMSHILWNKTDGTVALWAVASDGSYTVRTYGPYADAPNNTLWTAIALSVGPDNVPHILWTNPDGKVTLWNVNPADGSFTHPQNPYGPFAGYQATALATGPDGVSHILWNKTDGTVSLWAVDPSFGFTYQLYGPYTGWTANAVSVGTDGAIHLLWNNTDGQVSFWDLDTQGNLTHTEYGPYPNGWVAVACSTDPTNLSHILWGRPDQTTSLWDVSSTDGSFNYRVYSPPMTSGYMPTALSAGP